MPGASPQSPRATMRLDKWLWQARFFKSRSLATAKVQAGHVRLNSERTIKPAQPVGAGDTLTFVQGNRVRVARILALGTRRGPAPEAQALYEDLTPAPDPSDAPAPGFDGSGRPTKKDRRAHDLSRRPPLE